MTFPTVSLASVLITSSLTVYLIAGYHSSYAMNNFGIQDVYGSSEKFCCSEVGFKTISNLPDSELNTNSTSPNLEFRRWGENNDLSINQVPTSSGNLTFSITGSTGDSPGGFISNDINSRDQAIGLRIGELFKTSENPEFPDPQVTISFNVTGKDDNQFYLRFVNGFLAIEGLSGNDYYQKVSSDPLNVIEFNRILQGDYSQLNNIIITIQPQTIIDPFTFSLTRQPST